ncbi:MAG: hypothetical protein RMJ98_01410 [Myxococcales bacterium]|nr:outer membrane protein transport protein [Polyangiaceae bacterium]MDW8247945.1 hypothetical protein [Myxococcales bacterium]
MFHRVPVLACSAALSLSPVQVHADVFSLWGAGATGVAEAGARSAIASDGTAVHHNPAGLAFGQGEDAEVGMLLTTSRLRAANRPVDLDQRMGIVGSTSFSPTLLYSLSLRIGFLFHTPSGAMLRVRTREAHAPQFPYYDNRSQRLVAVPGLGLRPVRWLGLGASLDALAGLTGTARLRPGPRGASEPAVNQQVYPSLRPSFGFRFDPYPRWHLAAMYRGAFAVNLETRTEATVAGVPLEAQVRQAHALYDPASLVLGAAWTPTRRLSVELDVGYHRWSRYQGPLLQARAELPGVRAEPSARLPSFRDTTSARLGGSTRVLGGAHQLRVRGGFGVESSMLGNERQGQTNLVDGARLVVAGGLSYEQPEALLGGMLVATLGVQLHHLPERSWAKVACQAAPCPADTTVGPEASAPSEGITDPGYPTLRGGGQVLAGVVSLGGRW